MWIRKDEMLEIAWDARQKALKEMKADVAWALDLAPETSWQQMLEIVKLYRDTIKYQNEKGISNG